jgi:hypothetical protein
MNEHFFKTTVNFWGDERLGPRVEFSRNSYKECIYCGKRSDIREHVPSKVFLNKPIPIDLPTLPACFLCNNSFSEDELFLALLVQIMKKRFYGSQYAFGYMCIGSQYHVS